MQWQKSVPGENESGCDILSSKNKHKTVFLIPLLSLSLFVSCGPMIHALRGGGKTHTHTNTHVHTHTHLYLGKQAHTDTPTEINMATQVFYCPPQDVKTNLHGG